MGLNEPYLINGDTNTLFPKGNLSVACCSVCKKERYMDIYGDTYNLAYTGIPIVTVKNR